MRVTIALLSLVAASSLGYTYKNDPSWLTFKTHFFKRYDTIDEEIYRYKIFTENMRLASHYNDNEREANYGMTQFSDKLSTELFY